jgi:hypothetical protein
MMPKVEAFSRELMERALLKGGERHLKDADGDFIVPYSAAASQTGVSFTMQLIAGGSKHDIFVVAVRSDKRFPRAQWPQVLVLINDWHRTKRWPKLYLDVADLATGEEAAVIAEGQLDCEQGAFPELLTDFYKGIIATADSFFGWLKNEHGL